MQKADGLDRSNTPYTLTQEEQEYFEKTPDFYKINETDKIWWVETTITGPVLFIFDKKKNL